MIRTVDENGDGKINYQEFRVMIGAKPNLTSAMAQKKKAEQQKAEDAAAKAKNAKNTGIGGTTTIGGIPIGGSSAAATNAVGNCLATTANSTMPNK